MELHDDALTLVAVVGFFIPTSTILVALRLYVRWCNRGFGVDDGLVLAGWALFIPSIAVLIPGAYNGLGMHDGHFTPSQMTIALKCFLIFELLCLPAIICIRNSLILTLSRLTRSRAILVLLYFLIFLNTAGTLGTLIFLIVQCRPFHANWVPRLHPSQCLPPDDLVAVAQSWSGVSVVVDWSVALLPIPLLWHVRMQWRVKGAVMGILGLGILASCATLIRIPLLPRLARRDDALHHVGAITLWAFVETGLGLFAASLTSLRPLLRRVFGPADEDVVLIPDHHQQHHHDHHHRRTSYRKQHHGHWYGGGGGGINRHAVEEEEVRSASRLERMLGRLRMGSAGGGGTRGYGYARGSRKAKGRSGEQLVESRGVEDSWETMVYGDTSVGMRTVVVEGGGAVSSADDGESQKSFVGAGDIKVRKSICVEVPDE